MKRLQYMMLLALIICATSVFAQYQAPQEIAASILKYEPAPAEPGNTVDIWLILDNQGGDLSNVQIRAQPEYPFSIAPGQQETVTIGSIPAGADATVKYRLLVDLDARYGDENVTFYYTYGKGLSWRKLEQEIDVQPQDVSVTISKYAVLPSTIRPGERATISLDLQNNGRLAVQSMDVTLEPDESFAIVGSGSTKRIPRIAAEGATAVNFTVIADNDATVNVHTFPVKLTYKDERGKSYNQTANIAVIVASEPELSILLERTELTKENRLGTVSFRIVNKGVVDLKYLTATLLPSADYTIISPSAEDYVGNLDSDDFESVEYKVRTSTEAPLFRVAIDYKDPYNKDYRQEISLPLTLLSAKDLGQGGSGMTYFVVLLLLAGAGWYAWRRYKQKQHPAHKR